MDKSYSLFGTSGIRGHADTLFTKQFCFDIGYAFIKLLGNHNSLGPIAVGIDPRESSPRIKDDLFQGLSMGNLKLFDEGVTPIPSLNWLIKKTEVEAAVMVTGSHIAPDLNGVKFYAHNEEISLEDQEELENIYSLLKDKEKPRNLKLKIIKESRAKTLYREYLLSLSSKKYPKWKVAIDSANGAQSEVMPALLKELGIDVLKLNCNINEDFIARDTDTDDKAYVEELKELVVREKCDFGIAFDGDGDRVVFIDEKGNFIPGEYSCSLIAKKIDTEVIVTPISASQVVDNIGKKVERTKVGSPYVIGKMKETGALFGFEPNGGAIFGDSMYTRDGGTMTIKLLNLLANSNKSISENVSSLPKYFMKRTKVDYKWELKDLIVNNAKKHFKGIKTEEIDGLKIWLDENTWLLFRSSANAPEFRVFAESKNEEKAVNLLKEGIEFINKFIMKNG